MKQYYFPNEIWTIIYEYDNTYKLKYKNCINELNRHFWYIRSNAMLEWIFHYHNMAKQTPINRLVHKISLLKYIIKWKNSQHLDDYRNINKIKELFDIHTICNIPFQKKLKIAS